MGNGDMVLRPKVNILLSTYNGEKYLTAQLDSLLEQTYENIKIYVRDDGSKDNTCAILSHYAQKGLINILGNPDKRNLGYMESFWILLRESGQADYYAFCDQDDIWYPDKVKLGVKALEQEDMGLPLLYSSSFVYCDENLNFEGNPITPFIPVTFKDVLFYTPAHGFTILINKTLRGVALSATSLMKIPHDSWCQKIAASMGKIVYDSTQTAKYRRHSSTVTSIKASRMYMTVQWLKNDIFGKGMSDFYFVLKRFYEEYADQLNDTDRQYLSIFMEQPVRPGIYFGRLFFGKRLRPSLGGELALRICFLINR